MSFPLLVYWAWECESSGAHTDVSCVLLSELTMAIVWFVLYLIILQLNCSHDVASVPNFVFFGGGQILKQGKRDFTKISSIASVVEAAVSEAPPFNSDVQSFQNFHSSVLCQWGCIIELLLQICPGFICHYMQINFNTLLYVTLPVKLKLSAKI